AAHHATHRRRCDLELAGDSVRLRGFAGSLQLIDGLEIILDGLGEIGCHPRRPRGTHNPVSSTRRGPLARLAFTSGSRSWAPRTSRIGTFVRWRTSFATLPYSTSFTKRCPCVDI